MPEIKFIVFAGIAIGIVINIIRQEGFFIPKGQEYKPKEKEADDDVK